MLSCAMQRVCLGVLLTLAAPMWAGEVIRGTVVDPAERPVAGARIRISICIHGSGITPLTFKSDSDDNYCEYVD